MGAGRIGVAGGAVSDVSVGCSLFCGGALGNGCGPLEVEVDGVIAVPRLLLAAGGWLD
jgi:hypothetical protein